MSGFNPVRGYDECYLELCGVIFINEFQEYTNMGLDRSGRDHWGTSGTWNNIEGIVGLCESADIFSWTKPIFLYVHML